jgi:sortase A
MPVTMTQPAAAVGSDPGTAKPTEGQGESSPQVVPITPAPGPAEIPIRLVIPSIGLDAPVIPAKTKSIKAAGGQEYQQWQAPDEFAAGWHDSSALLGQTGNIVLNGHHNVYGKVFSRLVDLKEGDLIIVYSADKTYEYSITNKMILPERNQQLDVRMDNARWILPSADERLTLITCWPAANNTHRLIIVAKPLGLGGG